jgi:hypothetical protein
MGLWLTQRSPAKPCPERGFSLAIGPRAGTGGQVLSLPTTRRGREQRGMDDPQLHPPGRRRPI